MVEWFKRHPLFSQQPRRKDQTAGEESERAGRGELHRQQLWGLKAGEFISWKIWIMTYVLMSVSTFKYAHTCAHFLFAIDWS